MVGSPFLVGHGLSWPFTLLFVPADEAAHRIHDSRRHACIGRGKRRFADAVAEEGETDPLPIRLATRQRGRHVGSLFERHLGGHRGLKWIHHRFDEHGAVHRQGTGELFSGTRRIVDPNAAAAACLGEGDEVDR